MESDWYHADQAENDVDAQIKALRRIDSLLEGLVSANAHTVIHDEIERLKKEKWEIRKKVRNFR